MDGGIAETEHVDAYGIGCNKKTTSSMLLLSHGEFIVWSLCTWT
jgi:hypothetical protein